LALANQQTGHTDDAHRWYDVGINWLKQLTDDGALRVVALAAMEDVAGLSPSQASRLVGRLQLDQQTEMYRQAIASNPNNPWVYAARASHFARRGLWRQAAQDYRSAIERNPGDPFGWLAAAPILVLDGQTDAYQELCRKLVAQFADPKDTVQIDVPCKVCLLLPGNVETAKAPLRRLRQAMDEDAVPDWHRAWVTGTRALEAYRLGQYDEALSWCKKSQDNAATTQELPRSPANAWTRAIEAMALYRSGKVEEARKALAESERMVPKKLRDLISDATDEKSAVDGPDVHFDWLFAEIQRREAEMLLAGKQIDSQK
jgi:tetratricopeptide (TPR) repeat protein